MNKLDYNSSFFLKVISDHLNSRRTDYIEGLDWDTILYYVRTHKLEGLFYFQCKDIIPEKLKSSFLSYGLYKLKSTRNKKVAADEIEKAFTSANINFVIVKGIEVAKLYPIPFERTMSDIDILVQSDNRIRAKDILISLGYLSQNVGIYEWEFDRQDVHVEIHNHLQYENVSSKAEFDYVENAWNHLEERENTTRKTLDWNFHLIFLLIHLKKHFVNGNVGIRPFIDLALVCNKAEIDIDLLKSDLDSLRLSEFASICFAFCKNWFDIDMPFYADTDESFYETSTEKIIKRQTFGPVNSDSDKSVLTLVYNQGVLKAFSSRYFPNIKYIREDPKFEYLNKYPILLPYAWVSRFIYALKAGKLTGETNRLTKFFTSGSKIGEYDVMLRDWGIDSKLKE